MHIMHNAQITCKAIRPSRTQCGVKAFTLLEMSVVLVIISIVLAGGALLLSSSLQKQQAETTKMRLAAIQVALLDYRRAFGRLPCPANISAYSTSSQYFGIAAIAGADNTVTATCLGGTPAANYYYEISGTDCFTADDHCIYGGMVPTKTLRLPDDYAFDGWGRRIFYALDGQFTIVDAFTTGTTTSSITYDVTNAPTRITIRRPLDTLGNHAAVSSLTAYVLVSFGPNGHGAYGRLSQDRIAVTSTNVFELKNCHCDTDGDDTSFDNIFYQGSPIIDTSNATNNFDDVVVYATRATLRSAIE